MTDWAIPQQAKLKYTQLFNLHDRSRSGFLSGLQCRDILLQSGLARKLLAEIWNLSDIDGDGQLTREEFILAMHLTNHVRAGLSLPRELPSDLVPPSYRRTRSISTTSVHSTTSASSSVGGNIEDQASQKSSEAAVGSFTSTSVLNTNSFEDKRRENFEKGRAELERRRLKILEQQSTILVEQLAASKKLVTEAKSKIDSMRSERDTKAGLITSLEAQLKTLQDRKAYLNQEELCLIALAKDLNLANPAQAELDNLATQAKQQSISHMKETLKDYIKLNEEKAAALVEANQRLEESKKQLKSLSETVIKTYDEYKAKASEAETKRVEFVDENKFKNIDLDSVWDSTPSFSSQTAPNFAPLPTESRRDPWATNPSDNEPFAFTTAIKGSEASDFSNNNAGFESKFDDSIVAAFEQKTDDSTIRKKYKALYGFDARNPDELTINPGDTIIGSDQVCEPGWISGELNGKIGLFPEAYVEPLIEEPVEEAIKNNIPSSQPEPSDPVESINDSIRSIASTNSAIKYKVVYAFEARNPDELTINPGDIVTGIEGAHEPGWLMGESNGQKGLFPESYVEKIAEAPQEQTDGGKLQRMSSVGSLRSKKSSSKRSEVATVIANYRALGQEQLNLEKGQLVLIRRKMDSGWWEGEIQVKGKKKQFGWFPASYVKLLARSAKNEQ